MGFNATTGDPETTIVSTDLSTLGTITADITTVAGISANVTTVAGISADVTTVAGDAADIATVAGISGDVSSVAAQAFKFLFDTSTSLANPGSGDVRYNDATPASVTAIAISNTPSGGADISAEIVTWDDSTNTALRGTLTIKDSATATTFQTFSITGAITDNGAWLQIPVTHVAGTTLPGSTDALFIAFTRTGDTGPAGAGSGDLLAANDLSDVNSASTSFANIKQAASTTASGVAELATSAETITGTDTGRVVTPAGLQAKVASATAKGIVELATTAETATGTDAAKAVTPDGLHDMTTLAGAAWFLDEDDMSSDSATKISSQQALKKYVDDNGGKFTVEYESGIQTITADATLVLAHSLGVIPTVVILWIKCNSGDAGWASGDFCIMPQDTAAIDAGFALKADATNLRITMGSGVRMLNLSTFNEVSLTISKWDIFAFAAGGSLG